MNDNLPAAPGDRGRWPTGRSGDAPSGAVYAPEAEPYDSGEVALRDAWTLLKRRWRTILSATLAVLALVAAWTILITPVWSASTLIRVEERESGLLMATELAALTGLGGAGGEIQTELRILRTRPVAEDVVDWLDLNFVVTRPRDVPRALLFETLDLGRETAEHEFEIRALGDGRYRMESGDDTPSFRVEFAAGDSVEIPGGVFVLTDLAGGTGADGRALPTHIEFETLPFQEAVKRLSEDMSATRPDRDANLLQVRYETTDRTLAHQVPNAVAGAFIARRTATNKSDARTAVRFIQAQVDSTYMHLQAMEDSLRDFQETQQVVAVEAEAEAHVERLATLQAQRTQLDAERFALSRLLADIDSDTTAADFRRLASFPTFFQNDAIASMLSSLVQADSARSALLARATPDHPDVIAIEGRISELERQLGSIGRNYRRSLDDQIAALDEELARFGAELEAVPEQQITYLRIQRQIELLGELYGTLQTRLKEAQVQEAMDELDVRVIEQAIDPLEPESPQPVFNLALGLSLGLVLGVLLAYLREYADTRLHDTDSIEILFGLPTLARIPRDGVANGRGGINVRRRGRGGSGSLVVPPAPAGPIESYRALRTNVGLLRGHRAVHTILVTSPSPGEGASEIAANLAVALALKGDATLLLDADMRRPSQHIALDVPRSPGLADYLSHGADLEAVIHQSGAADALSVLPGGAEAEDPTELLESARFEDLLRALRSRYASLVVTGPPLLALTDSAVLAPKGDGVLLVVRVEKSEKEAIALAIRQLRQVDAEIVGVVVNEVRSSPRQSTYAEYFGRAEASNLKGLLSRIRGIFRAP